jgi:alpha-1,3-rhamnosyl/mannosyltransferase
MADGGAPVDVALVGHRLAVARPTGVARYAVELSTALGELGPARGIRYTVASLREAGRPTWVPPTVRLASLGGPRRARAVAWSLVHRPRVARALGRPDLVHLLHPWAPLPTRAPLVATVHDLLPLERPAWFGRAERWSFERAVHDLAARAEVVVASSHHTAARLEERLGIEPGRLRVVWLGVGDELRARPSPAEQAAVCARHGVEPGRFLLAVGEVNERKNLPVLVRALALVDPAALGPVARLVAGSAGRGAGAVEAAVAGAGLTDRIRFAGFVPDADLRVLLGASAALVHPSLEEGFGLTPLEAMAAGAPAVASAVGSVPEVVGDGAILVDPHDADAWAAAITTVTGDADARGALVAAGTARQARFTWRRTAEETAAVHAEVLGR